MIIVITEAFLNISSVVKFLRLFPSEWCCNQVKKRFEVMVE